MKSNARPDVTSLNRLIENAIREYWDKPALTDYGGSTLLYSDLATEIKKLCITFRKLDLKHTENVAICGRNCANWTVAFVGTIAYGAVAVPILHEFKPEQILNILEHSDSRLLFVSDNIWKEITTIDIRNRLPHLGIAISLTDFSILYKKDSTPADSTESMTKELRQYVDSYFNEIYPDGIHPYEVFFANMSPTNPVVINYTSGSTGKSKGVVLSQQNLWSNVKFAIDILGDRIKEGSVISMLPMAHMYGLAFEILSELSLGMHIYLLGKLSPTVMFKAFSEIKPTLIVCVPLIIEKIIRRMVMPKLQKPLIKCLMRLPVIGKGIRWYVRSKLDKAFGGKFYEVIIGGAALSEDVSEVLHDIGFRYTVGYGTTECAPLISYTDYSEYVPNSCGKATHRMKIKIDSPDPANIVGEILVKGTGVMLGYFKNEEATREAIDADGWYHTGDLGLLHDDGTLFIRGRSKNMLLGPNGQNIYPEEIEDKLNATPLVAESVVIQRNSRLYALIYPDTEEAQKNGIQSDKLHEALETIRLAVNQQLPSYEQIAGIKIMSSEFEKTPKKNIKRYLYTEEDV